MAITVRDQLKKYQEESRAAQEKMIASLKEVDQLKDEFLVSTSHELRTPLISMVGIAESLLDNFSDQIPNNAKQNIHFFL